MNNLTKTILVLALLAAPMLMMAQTEESSGEIQSLFGKHGKRHSHGGYGGVVTGYTQIGDYDAILVGGQGAWVIDHGFSLGLAGYGFATERKFDTELNDRYLVAGGYGGLLFEFMLNPLNTIHVNFPLVIGAGGVSYTESSRDFDIGYSEDDQAFFVVEPGVELQVNVVKFMRIAIGAKYRYTSNVDLKYQVNDGRILDQGALRGFTGTFTFKFGKF